jgi:putative transposase
MRYRRARIPGASHFFTLNLADRRSDLLVRHVGLLRDVVRRVRHTHPFEIEAMVVLPDHLHAIWRLPMGDADFSTRWMLIKSAFSRRLPGGEPRSSSRIAKGERGIWQRRFWEHLLRDERDFERHVDYIHFNPVKHRVAARPSDWPHSSIHRYIKLGLVPAEWAWGDGSDDGFGE